MTVTQPKVPEGAAFGMRRPAWLALEASGNFVLVFAFGTAIAMYNWFAPLVIGAALVAMVYSRRRAPEAHYSPALTLAMVIRRRLSVCDAFAYWLVQSGAGLLAAASVCAIVDPEQLAITAAMTLQGVNLVAALAVELVFICALCSVALEASTASSNAVDAHHGWPTTFSVIAAAIAIGVITTGAVDPAVGPHIAVLGLFSWSTIWLYLVTQLVSGIATTITFVGLADHQ